MKLYFDSQFLQRIAKILSMILKNIFSGGIWLAGILFLWSPISIAQVQYTPPSDLETSSGQKVIDLSKSTQEEKAALEAYQSGDVQAKLSAKHYETRDPKKMSWTFAFDELIHVFSKIQMLTSTEVSGNTSGFAGEGTSLLEKAGQINAARAELVRLKTNRIVHTAIQVQNHQKVTRGLRGMAKRKNKLHMFYYFIAAIVGLMLLKSWQLSKLEKGDFKGRCWVELQSFVFNTGAAVFVVPLLFYGHSYSNVLKGLYEVLSNA